MPDEVGLLASVVYFMLATPDPPPSLALRATETGEVLFQPAPLAVGVSSALTVGAVTSIVNVTGPAALDVAVHEWYAATAR